MSKDWDNEDKLTIRTRLGLRVLMLMFMVIAPYQFATKFREGDRGAEKARVPDHKPLANMGNRPGGRP